MKLTVIKTLDWYDLSSKGSWSKGLRVLTHKTSINIRMHIVTTIIVKVHTTAPQMNMAVPLQYFVIVFNIEIAFFFKFAGCFLMWNESGKFQNRVRI